MIEEDQGSKDAVEAVFNSLLSKSNADPVYRLAIISATIVLIQNLASGLPLGERQAWATQLYKLADELAAGERS